MNADPLIVSMIGGPGAGKSTTAAYVFARLKDLGFDTELVGEPSKDATWEEHEFLVRHQPYLMGAQLRAYDRLYGKVDVIVTDSTTLTSPFYNDAMKDRDASVAREWREFIVADWQSRRTLNVILYRRPEDYSDCGRPQTLDEALQHDVYLMRLVKDLGLPHIDVEVGPNVYSHGDFIVEETIKALTPAATRHHHLLRRD